MNNKEFIQRFEELTGLDCYFEDFDINEFLFGDFGEIGITIEDGDRISIFKSFGYYDHPKSEQDEESKAYDDLSYAQENAFYFYLKTNDAKHNVTKWDDGSYMCPGYVLRIGLYNYPYSDEIITNFVNLVNNYSIMIDADNISKLRRYIVCTYYALYHDFDVLFSSMDSSRITFYNSTHIEKKDVDRFYKGKEYYFFQIGNDNYVASRKSIDCFLEAVEYSELDNFVNYSISDDLLYVESESMTLTLPCHRDEGLYYKIEENYLMNSCSELLPFSSEIFKKAFIDFYKRVKLSTSSVFVITEGCTDWMHLKKHWLLLKNDFKDLDLDFFEYSNKINMGSSALLEMCRSFSKIRQEKKLVFIFDRDEKSVINQVSDKNKLYKNWNNNVYSIAIPIPNHREDDDAICIEHLYLDSEIKEPYLCDDGIKRRLYLGNEFDEFGRNIKERLLCTRCKLCGINSMKIIDGTTGEKVVSAILQNNVNYALSKHEFANKIEINEKSESFTAFKKIFDIISDIDKLD